MGAIDDGGRGQESREARPHRHHRLRWVLVSVLGVLAIVIGVSALLSYQGRARQVSVSEAARNFHSTDPAGGSAHPAPGVYTYAGSGTEQLTVPPLSQSQGPTIPGTVELSTDGCWQLRIDYSTNHWESTTFCTRAAGIEEVRGQTWHKWMVGPVAVTDLTVSTCDSGSMLLPTQRSPGQAWPARCTSTSTAAPGTGVSSGHERYIGETTVRIGSTRIEAAHFLRTRTLSGAQQGTEHTDLWIDPSDGLVLEQRRSFDVRTDTILGTSTYSETGSFELTSLRPTT